MGQGCSGMKNNFGLRTHPTLKPVAIFNLKRSFAHLPGEWAVVWAGSPFHLDIFIILASRHEFPLIKQTFQLWPQKPLNSPTQICLSQRKSEENWGCRWGDFCALKFRFAHQTFVICSSKRKTNVEGEHIPLTELVQCCMRRGHYWRFWYGSWKLIANNKSLWQLTAGREAKSVGWAKCTMPALLAPHVGHNWVIYFYDSFRPHREPLESRARFTTKSIIDKRKRCWFVLAADILARFGVERRRGNE